MSDSDEANNNETGPMTPPPTTQYDSFQTPSPSNPFSSYGLVDNTPASISYSEQSGSEPSPVWSQGSQALSPVWSQGSQGLSPVWSQGSQGLSQGSAGWSQGSLSRNNSMRMTRAPSTDLPLGSTTSQLKRKRSQTFKQLEEEAKKANRKTYLRAIEERLKKTINTSIDTAQDQEEKIQILKDFKNNGIVDLSDTTSYTIKTKYIEYLYHHQQLEDNKKKQDDQARASPCFICKRVFVDEGDNDRYADIIKDLVEPDKVKKAPIDKAEEALEVYARPSNDWSLEWEPTVRKNVKKHRFCVLHEVPLRAASSVSRGENKRKQPKRLQQTAWEEHKSTSRSSEYFNEYYPDLDMRGVVGITKSLVEIREAELHKLKVHIDSDPDPGQDREFFMRGSEDHKTRDSAEWGNRRCYLCNQLLLMEIRSNHAVLSRKNYVDRFKSLNGSALISADVEHIKQLANHNYYLFGQMTPAKYNKIENKILNKLTFRKKKKKIELLQLITRIVNEVDKKLMRHDFHTSEEAHITAIKNILNSEIIEYKDQDIIHLLVLVLLAIEYKWSHSVCNRIKMDISFFMPRSDHTEKKEWYLRPNIQTIQQFVDELVSGRDGGSDTGTWKKIGDEIAWKSDNSSGIKRKKRKSKTSHHAIFREDVLAKVLNYHREDEENQTQKGINSAQYYVGRLKEKMRRDIFNRIQRICRIHNTKIGQETVPATIKSIKEELNYGSLSYDMYETGRPGQTDARTSMRASETGAGLTKKEYPEIVRQAWSRTHDGSIETCPGCGKISNAFVKNNENGFKKIAGNLKLPYGALIKEIMCEGNTSNCPQSGGKRKTMKRRKRRKFTKKKKRKRRRRKSIKRRRRKKEGGKMKSKKNHFYFKDYF